MFFVWTGAAIIIIGFAYLAGQHSRREIEPRCYACGAKQLHINDGGGAWCAYKGHRVVLYCNNRECGSNITHCHDLDIVRGYKCPACGEEPMGDELSA